MNKMKDFTFDYYFIITILNIVGNFWTYVFPSLLVNGVSVLHAVLFFLRLELKETCQFNS